MLSNVCQSSDSISPLSLPSVDISFSLDYYSMGALPPFFFRLYFEE